MPVKQQESYYWEAIAGYECFVFLSYKYPRLGLPLATEEKKREWVAEQLQNGITTKIMTISFLLYIHRVSMIVRVRSILVRFVINYRGAYMQV